MREAILSSFNSALNSSCTLFSVGLYKNVFRKDATEHQVVRSGKIFGWIIVIDAMVIAPLLDHPSIRDWVIFDYLQKMNGIDFIPIFAVVLIGMLTKLAASMVAQIGLVVGFAAIAIGYFVPPSYKIVASLHEFRFLVIVFFWLSILMLVIGEVKPREAEFEHEVAETVDMTP